MFYCNKIPNEPDKPLEAVALSRMCLVSTTVMQNTNFVLSHETGTAFRVAIPTYCVGA